MIASGGACNQNATSGHEARRHDIEAHLHMLMIRVLGPVNAEISGHPVELRGAHQRRLLGILTAADGHVVSTDRLVDQLWEGAPPDAASRTFRTYVARLRRSLEAAGAADGAQLIVTEPPGYRLAREVHTDADAFASAVEEARDSLAVGEPASAWNTLNEALTLWSGNAFDEFASEDWASASAIRLDELRLVARELRVSAQSEIGRHSEAIAEIDALVAEHPLRETPRRELMIALYRDGRHAEALRAGREYTKYLGEETGLEPSAAITEVETMIIEGDPRLDAVPQGRRLRGYLLDEPVAENELGIVYRARQPSIGRHVAITAIAPELADDSAFVRGFESRAQAVASVEHPGVVPIYDYWREPGGAYLVTRYYEGGTLDARRAHSPLAADDAWTITKQLMAALWAAHQRGVAHGNLGPKAVWFDDRGDAVLGGFAMSSDVATHHSDLADLGDLVGDLVDDLDTGTTASARNLSALALRLRGDGTDRVATVHDLLIDVEDGTDEYGLDLAPIIGPNPFKGLAPFSEVDAELFFGRSAIVDELDGVLRRRGLAALIGPSGSGKSSVMRAGLLPRYRAAGAYVTTMVPGTHPLDELETALTRIAATPLPGLAEDLATEGGRLGAAMRSIAAGPEREIILAIDQFEEFFTISEPSERDRFLQILGETLNDGRTNVRVVTTCRADFMGRVLNHPIAGPLLRDRSVLVTPLSSEDLHDVIIGPAEHAGVAVEPALVAQIVGDAAGGQGSLPMVQYVLTEVFEAASDGGVMTLRDYERLGGVSSGLAQRAEEVFNGLSPADRAAARRLFVRLVAPGDASEPTRRRALRSELTTVPKDVIEAFGTARLLAFDRDPATREPTIEVSHEALIRHWPRLMAWIDEEAEGLQLLGHLTSASREWVQSDRDPSLLYRGSRLVTSEQWAESHVGELSDVESEFVGASTAARVATEHRERRSLKRLRGLTTGLAVFLVLAVIAAGVAITARQRADDRAQEAEEARTVAQSAEQESADRTAEAEIATVDAQAARADAEAAAADAEAARDQSDETRRSAEVSALAGNARVLAASDPITAMLLAVEASARGSADEPAVAAALLESLSADPRVRSLSPPIPSTGLVIQPKSGPFYTYVRASDDGAVVEVLNVENGTTRTLDLDFVPGAATTDPSGAYVYAVLDDRLLLYDVATGEVVADEPAANFLVSAAGLGDDLISVHPDGRLVVQTLPDLTEVSSSEVSPTTFALAASSDGETVALLNLENNLVVTALDGSAERREFPLPTSSAIVALDGTASLVAVSDVAGPTVILDLSDAEAPPLVIDAGASSDLAFSPDGGLLAIGTADGIEIYDSATGDSAAERLVFTSGVTFHFTGARTLRAFATSLGVLAIDLDAPSRIVTEFDLPEWGVAGFLAPDLSGAVSIVIDETGAPIEEWISSPTALQAVTPQPIGPRSATRQSRPIGDARFVTADTTALSHTVSDASGVIQRIDLAGEVSSNFEHFISPKVGRNRDILILAEDGVVLRRTEVVVVDRARGAVIFSLAERGATVADFARGDESQLLVGDVDGRVRWFDLDGTGDDSTPAASAAEVFVGASVGAFAVTPDGDLTAVGDWSGTVTVFDEDRQVVTELSNDAPFPIRMAFVDDGARLIVQSEDGSIVLWDIGASTRIGTLYRADGLRGAFEVSLDERTIVVGNANGIAEISIDPDDWQRLGCQATERRLTEVELRSVVTGVESVGDACAGSD